MQLLFYDFIFDTYFTVSFSGTSSSTNSQIQPFLAASLFVKITSRQDLLKVKLLMLLMSQNSIP